MYLFVQFVCFSFLLYKCALVTFFIKGYLTWLYSYSLRRITDD